MVSAESLGKLANSHLTHRRSRNHGTDQGERSSDTLPAHHRENLYRKGHSVKKSCISTISQNVGTAWSRRSKTQRLVLTILVAFTFATFTFRTAAYIVRAQIRQARRRREALSRKRDEEKLKQIMGLGRKHQQPSKKEIVPWELANTGRDPTRDRLVEWWETRPYAPLGLSCASSETTGDNLAVVSKVERRRRRGAYTEDTYFFKGFGISPPVFRGRIPEEGSTQVQVAYVLPFVEFQLGKVTALLTEHWDRYPPCESGTPKQSADLIFFTENELSNEIKQRIRYHYKQLGTSKIGCFRGDEPFFLNAPLGNLELSHLEGAAYTFYSLFRLLEKHYKTFFLAEPDVAPVQPNFLPALVEKSQLLGCEADGLWQVGSLPLAKDINAGMLRERVDYHMNGNAIYILGCPEFEEYKCRVQTFYVPKDECLLVAGCSTHDAYEGGYDHAMYRFRMHSANYEYSRLVLHKFSYSNFLQNRGEASYAPEEVVKESPSTFFVHSKSIYQNEAATLLKEVSLSVLKRDPCNRDKVTTRALEKIYRNLRSAEYNKADAIRALCDASKYNLFGPPQSKELCELYGTKSALEQDWSTRMPGKTYLWTIDFHGGPVNCDMSMITQAGGAIHAEIDGICHFYNVCKERLKVIKADNWKEFDPTDQQKRDFEIAYRDDPEFKRVDAFICHHPVANCELFLPFNRSIIIHATTRLEFGRHDEGIDWRLASGYDREVGKEKWKAWVRTVQNLAKDKRNVIAANNVYDRDYIKYFTGIKNVELLPSWCGDNIGTSFCESGWDSNLAQAWMPTRPEVMIVPYRSNLDRTRYKTAIRDPVQHPIIKELAAVPRSISNGTEVKLMRELYTDANPLRMLQHPAIVILPYQVSTMQLVELYRLNIPTFCPSLSLLKRWCREHDLMWEVHYGWPENIQGIKDIPDPNGRPLMDKYSEEWEKMFDHWIPKSDFYQFEHITYFDSWEDFHQKYQLMVSQENLRTINGKMAMANAQLRGELIEKWKDILQRVKRHQ